MRSIWTIAGGIALIATVSAPAYAADIPLQTESMYVDPQIQPSTGWSGFYAGVYGGYNWITAGVMSGPDIDDANGVDGGAYVGFNREISNNFVLGLETMGGFSAADGATAGTSINQDWEASLRARMGYAFEQNMIYGLAGLAASAFEFENPTGSTTNTHLGWTVGAGVETMLSNNIAARLEYGYSDYSKESYNIGGTSTNIDPTSHSLKLGIGLKF